MVSSFHANFTTFFMKRKKRDANAQVKLLPADWLLTGLRRAFSFAFAETRRLFKQSVNKPPRLRAWRRFLLSDASFTDCFKGRRVFIFQRKGGGGMSSKKRNSPPARTEEEREKQLINLAENLAEK